MKTSYRLSAIAMAGLMFYGCSTEVQELTPMEPSSNPISAPSSARTMAMAGDVLHFEHYEAGTIVHEVYGAFGNGPVKVWGTNPKYPDRNAAMIFDSNAPTGNDPDLGTPNIDFGGPGIGAGGQEGSPYANESSVGKILIITEDFNTSNPNDANLEGAMFRFDFSALGSVTVRHMFIMDIDRNEKPASIEFYDAMGNQLGSTFSSPITGDNGVASMNFNNGAGVSGVVTMVVTLNGSGAIDNIIFEPVRQPETGCTYTLGYWKTHSSAGSAKKRNATWNMLGPMAEATPFYMSGHSYLQAMQTPPRGNAYYILATQYIAARLNRLSGASAPEEVRIAMNAASTLFEMFTPAQVAAMDGSHYARKEFINHAHILDQYNNGLIGPGHCDK
jgi:hypothetical protein